jgi:uncharacterized protein YbcI
MIKEVNKTVKMFEKSKLNKKPCRNKTDLAYKWMKILKIENILLIILIKLKLGKYFYDIHMCTRNGDYVNAI